MKVLVIFSAAFLSIVNIYAQQVPHKIDFADMELKLTKEAIEDIQADVDALTRSETYFQKKLERVDMYLPIIERIFKEEGLPDDFKYLVIQESALISDAVSSSNAVGFWQFKEISGLENDLRIDRIVDERKNIVSATRAAANYLKNHNKVFDNWAYALIAYQTGVGGAKSVINERYYGAKKLPITKNTYWYLKKYLAHKIAFENTIGTSRPTYYLEERTEVQNVSLSELAEEYQIDKSLIEDYNKWLTKDKVPDDKNYTVIIPLAQKPESSPQLVDKKSPSDNLLPYDLSSEENQPIDIENGIIKNATIAHEIKVNGLKAIVAAEGYTVNSLSEKAGLSEKKFRRINDMSINQKLIVGEIYYLEKKTNRAKYYYHTVQVGESMWSISQRYGLKLHKLYRKNRMKDPTKPTVGRVLWLRLNRPQSVDIEYKIVKAQDEVLTTEENKNYVEKELNQEASEEIEVEIPTEVNSNSEILADQPKDTLIAADTIKVKPTLSMTLSKETVEDSLSQKDSNSIESELIEQKPTEESDEVEFEEELPIQNNLVEYRIKKGDTFFSIANRFNMQISDLLSVNNLSIKDPLSIDQVILVRNSVEISETNAIEPKSPDSATNYDEKIKKHRVSAGETLYGIAKSYNVSLTDLMKWNNKTDYSIKEGEIINVSPK